jgi:hypothetical protein
VRRGGVYGIDPETAANTIVGCAAGSLLLRSGNDGAGNSRREDCRRIGHAACHYFAASSAA